MTQAANSVFEVMYRDQGRPFSVTVVASEEQAQRVAALLGGEAEPVVGWCPEFESLEMRSMQ
jgi:hypothetical protein